MSVPELVTPLSPSGGILVSCVVVLHLESPPPSGCGASFKSFAVSCAGLPLAQCCAARERWEAGKLEAGGRAALGQRPRRA